MGTIRTARDWEITLTAAQDWAEQSGLDRI